MDYYGMVRYFYDDAALVFRGRVLEVTPPPPVPSYEVTRQDGSKEWAYLYAPGMSKVRLEVLEVFKGELGHEVVVQTDSSLRRSDEFLVFASGGVEKGFFVNGACGGGAERMDAPQAASHLAALRAHFIPPTGSIVGKVSMGDGGGGTLPEVLILLAGEGTPMVAAVENHRYVFKDVPAGTYTVSAVAPDGYTVLGDESAMVVVKDKESAEADWELRRDAPVKKSVVNAGARQSARGR